MFFVLVHNTFSNLFFVERVSRFIFPHPSRHLSLFKEAYEPCLGGLNDATKIQCCKDTYAAQMKTEGMTAVVAKYASGEYTVALLRRKRDYYATLRTKKRTCGGVCGLEQN